MSLVSRANISIKKSPVHGMGVFAEEHIKKDGLIEQCYVLVGDFGEAGLNYSFNLVRDDPEESEGFATGYGAIYNHSDKANARFYYDKTTSILSIFATSTIRRGEEIFIRYGNSWFESRKAEPIQASVWFKTREIIKRIARQCFRTGIIILAIIIVRELSIRFMVS